MRIHNASFYSKTSRICQIKQSANFKAAGGITFNILFFFFNYFIFRIFQNGGSVDQLIKKYKSGSNFYKYDKHYVEQLFIYISDDEKPDIFVD